ncbi:MAG TPA: hypothetical protein PLZ36_11975, partial [Armatimonadota bacterium]|nr:hypothetical protein [Armatimonadota bacterium]
PAAGACTCDNLMDEHLMIGAPDLRQCPDGWYHLRVTYRLFSLPAPLAAALAARTTPLETGPMLAWKFQYAPCEGAIGTSRPAWGRSPAAWKFQYAPCEGAIGAD